MTFSGINCLHRCIGYIIINTTGEFGVVYKGWLKNDSFNHETVAIKTLKGIKLETEFSHDDFVMMHNYNLDRCMMTP